MISDAPRGRAPRVLETGVNPIRHDKAADIIAGELRRLIVRDGSPGDHLPPERVLIEQFGVSRPTLREAMRVLESEGLVEIRRGVQGGAVIRPSSIDELARVFGTHLQIQRTTLGDLFAARAVIEPAAARLAAANPLAGETLDRLLDEEERRLAASDEAMSDVFLDFHDGILALAGSQTLHALGRLLGAVVKRDNLRKISALTDAGEEARRKGILASHRSHRRLAEIIKAGDGEHAERAMRKHLDVLLRRFSGEAGADELIDLLPPGRPIKLP